MKFSDYPEMFRPDAVAFWIGAAQSIACSDALMTAAISRAQYAQDIAVKADALTLEFLKRLEAAA